jgi:hypothetical protein
MKKQAVIKYVSLIIFLLAAVLFVAKFAGPSFLRLYIEAGIGGCRKIPIFCMAPSEEISVAEINRAYLAELIPHRFRKVEISAPKGFSVIQEMIKQVYYKRQKRPHSGAVIYLLYKEPDFFAELFPQAKKQGVKDNYDFIRRVMFARVKNIANLTDAFFVIMKGVFIPDLGEQKSATMAQVILPGKRGFINYNFAKGINYFDCNIIGQEGDFFKIYIKDRGAQLDLEKVLAIISTAHVP